MKSRLVKSRLVRWSAIAMTVVVAYFGVTFVQVWAEARKDDAPRAGAIVVLGAAEYDGVPSEALRLRLDHAIDLYRQGVAPLVVLTGGRQQGDRFTEAGVGFLHMRAAGIPESALQLENQGTDTWESLKAASRFLRAEGVHEVVLVSSPYHSLRVERIADDVGLVGHASPARSSSGSGSFGNLARETLAVGLGRIIGYHRLSNLDHRASRSLIRPSKLCREGPSMGVDRGRLAEGTGLR